MVCRMLCILSRFNSNAHKFYPVLWSIWDYYEPDIFLLFECLISWLYLISCKPLRFWNCVVFQYHLHENICFFNLITRIFVVKSSMDCLSYFTLSNLSTHFSLLCTVVTSESGKFLLSAKRHRKTTCTEYTISMDSGNISRSSRTYIGKIR